jgi:phage/plasmid-associated DNA primase
MDGENPPPDSLLGRLLDGVFIKGDPDAGEKHKLLAEVAGAAAVGYGPKLRDPKAIVEVGETAGNGKSAVLDALRGLLPKTAVASISANKFGDEKYVVRLIGKLLNATDELSSAGAIASEIFKTVITGQPVEGRELYRSVVEFRPVAQHIFATNRLPKFTDGMDRGVKRRLLPLTFNRVIPTEERIENIGLRIADEEADLVLAFAVAGAQRLIRQRDFTIPASSKEALQQWIYRDNPVLAWVEVRVEAADPPRPGEKVVGIKSSMAHAMFRDWALAEGFAERGLPDVTGFVQRLKENQRVPGIKVRHTNSGNFLVGLKILAQDRDPAAEGIDEMRRPGGVNLNKGEGWPGRI